MAAIENSKSEVNEEALRYQARTALADLANEIAATRNLESTETVAKIKKAAKIRYWLKALDYKEFLTRQEREQIWYKLIEISGIYNFPTAPILELRTRPNILTGVAGPVGATGASGDGIGGIPFAHTGIGIGVTAVDLFPITTSSGVFWFYTVKKGANQRSGHIEATWLANGSAIESGDDNTTTQIGDTSDVQLSVDITGGNVRLLATSASTGWTIEGTRSGIPASSSGGGGGGGAFWPLTGLATLTGSVTINAAGAYDITLYNGGTATIDFSQVNIGNNIGLGGAYISTNGGNVSINDAVEFQVIAGLGGRTSLGIFDDGGNVGGVSSSGHSQIAEGNTIYIGYDGLEFGTPRRGISFYTGPSGTPVNRLYISEAGVWTLSVGSDATGDIYYRNSSGNFIRRGIGSSGQVLTVSGGLPVWASLGGGTVTTVSVVTNQGVSGSVANPTTTPAITLSLGALTGVTSFNGLVVTANTGAITTGTWSGTTIAANKGGTGLSSFTTGQTFYASSSSAISALGIGIDNSVYVVTSGLPSWVGSLTVPSGGTGLTSFTAYAVVTGGTTSTGALQQVSGVGSSGQVLTSNGAAALPTWQTVASWLLASGGTLTGANTITGTTTNILKYVFNSLGTTITDGAGQWLANTTAATNGAQQQSPYFTQEGQGFATGVNNSQSVKFVTYTVPVQAATNPTGIWTLAHSINGGAYVTDLQINSSGIVLASGIRRATSNSTLSVQGQINSTATASVGINNTGISFSATSGTQSQLEVGNTVSPFAPTSGSAAFNDIVLATTINQTGGANGQIIAINGNLTITAAVNVTGFDWNPITPANITGTHYGFRSVPSAALGGVALSAPLHSWDVGGSFGANITSTSTDITLNATHYTVKVDASGANRTITLPASAGVSRRIYIIKKTDSSANTVTIDGNASETLDGATTKVINTQWAGYAIQSDGTNWIIIATF